MGQDSETSKVPQGADSPPSPCSADLIRAAWERYHGPIIDEGGEEYIPAMPPAFMRGFVDGYEHGKREHPDMVEAAHGSAILDMEARRKEFEHATCTWKRANDQKCGGNWPVLYDAGELGFCLLEWTGAFGGHWKNRWFDKAETLSPNVPGQVSPEAKPEGIN